MAPINTNTIDNVWKPIKFENVFANVFYNNFRCTDAPNYWIDLKVYDKDGNEINQSVPSAFNSTNFDFDFQFVLSSSDEHYNGNYNSSRATRFDMSLGNTSEGVNRALLAKRHNVNELPDTIAIIKGVFDVTDPAKIRKMKIELQKTDYAKALLNYKPHWQVDDADVLKATVALVATSKQTYNNIPCPVPVINNKFNVRFLRPITLLDTNDKVITDAHAEGYYTQKIRLDSLINDYTDWRAGYDATNNLIIPNWKPASPAAYPYTPYDYATDYYKYYAKEDSNRMLYQIENLSWAAGTYVSSNVNVMTDLGLSESNRDDPTKAIPLQNVARDLDFKTTGVPYELEYLNNSATVGTFHVWFPVAIEYYWGKMYTTVKVTIKRTKGSDANAARRK